MEASNLSGREFTVIIIRILNSMKTAIREKQVITVKKVQSEKKKNAISDTNNTLEGINSRLDEAKDQISVLEDKVEKKSGRATKRKKEFIKMRRV